MFILAAAVAYEYYIYYCYNCTPVVSIRLISVQNSRIRFDVCQKTPVQTSHVYYAPSSPLVTIYFLFLRFPLEIKSLRTARTRVNKKKKESMWHFRMKFAQMFPLTNGDVYTAHEGLTFHLKLTTCPQYKKCRKILYDVYLVYFDLIKITNKWKAEVLKFLSIIQIW